MKQPKYLRLFSLVSAVSGGIWLLASLPTMSQPVVQLETKPPLNQVIPDTEPIRIKLRAVDTNGQPLPNANFQVRLFTPSKMPWFTSDFPIVEGTTLLELDTTKPSGELQFDQTLPIRGTYRMEVKVSPQVVGAFEPFEQSLTFSVPENPVKYRNFAMLAAILLLTGFGGGWVIGGTQKVRQGEIAPQSVRLLLSGGMVVAIAALLLVNISAELSSGHAEHESEARAIAPSVQKSQGIEARLLGDTQTVVGKTATQTVQVVETATGKPISNVILTIQSVALEHHQHIFAYQGSPDTTGRFTWQEQFVDGAPHQVVVNVKPLASATRLFQPFQVAHKVDVEGIAPPLTTRLISLIYFTALFGVGLLAGLWLRYQVSMKRPNFSPLN